MLWLLTIFLHQSALALPKGPHLVESDDITAPDDVQEDADTGFSMSAMCDTQRLHGGERMPEMPELYTLLEPNVTWGTTTMVNTLLHAAEEIAWQIPKSDPVVIGDISHEHGGFMAGHRSHRGGLDADIGLYWGDAQQYQRGFITVAPSQLDADTTWTFISAMLDTGNVERILLDSSLIRMVRKAAIRSGDLSVEEAYQVFPTGHSTSPWNQTGVVHHSPGHRHHMHLRVSCDADS